MENKSLLRKKTVIQIVTALVLVALFVLALISIKQGFHNATLRSKDFMWSPTVLLSQHRNPFQVFLDGNQNHEIILRQQPNYLHLIYILLLPFAYLDWETAKIAWGLTNILLAIINGLLACKIFRLNVKQSSFLILLFLASTPFRNGVGNGQQQEIVLLFFLLGASLRNQTYAAIFTGMSYLKYSFAPAIAQTLYLRRGLHSLLISLAVPLVAAAIFSLIILENPFRVLIQPFLVSATGIDPGAGDLMTIIEKIGENHNGILFKLGFYLVPLASSLIAGMEIYRRSQRKSVLTAYTALSSLVFFKHLNYDYIFLLPLMAVAITTESLRARLLIGFGVLYHWYGLKVFDQILENSGSLLYLNFLINILMLFTITQVNTADRLREDNPANVLFREDIPAEHTGL